MRGINLGQGLSVLSFTLVNLSQLVAGAGQRGIKPQRLAQIDFRLPIISQERVHQSELVVVVCHVGFEGCVFEELLFGFRQFLFLVVRDSEIKVRKGKFGIGFEGEIEILDGVVVLFTVDVRFSQQQMQLGRVLAGFDQLPKARCSRSGRDDLPAAIPKTYR